MRRDSSGKVSTIALSAGFRSSILRSAASRTSPGSASPAAIAAAWPRSVRSSSSIALALRIRSRRPRHVDARLMGYAVEPLGHQRIERRTVDRVDRLDDRDLVVAGLEPDQLKPGLDVAPRALLVLGRLAVPCLRPSTHREGTIFDGFWPPSYTDAYYTSQYA